MRQSLIGWTMIGILFCAPANAQEINLLVPADVEWIDTGVTIGPEQKVSVTASGLWTLNGWEYVSPSGYIGAMREGASLPTASFASLIGRVGAKVFPIGGSAEIALEGSLFVAMNDIPRSYSDNSGYLAVKFQLQPCDAACRKTAGVVR